MAAQWDYAVRHIFPSVEQSSAIVQAMQAVVTAEGRVDPLPIEVASINAIQRHLLHQPEPILVSENTMPANLADIVVPPDMRLQTVRYLTLLPVIDQQVRADKVQVVEAVARQLAVEDRGLTILRQAVKRQHRRIGMGAMTRSVAHYWSPTGKARLRDWLDMARIMMPAIPGLYSMLTDEDLLAKYRALGQKPDATMGRVLHDFYIKRGFPLPGEPKSFPEGWGKHEVYHILGEYDTTLQGEMLNAAFSGGNTEQLCMDLLLATLLQFHAGRQILPGPAPVGLLEPDVFFRAIARGASMNVDLLRGWNLWSIVDMPVAEIRTNFELPLLSPQERQELARSDALLA
jgi:hypothetical protein